MPPPSTGGGQQQLHPHPQHQHQQQQQGGAPLVGGPDDQRFHEAPQGVRDVLINRPNEQTSFGFVLQSNTLRAGCMICEYRKCNLVPTIVSSLSPVYIANCYVIPYSRKYWRELNLVVEPKIACCKNIREY